MHISSQLHYERERHHNPHEGKQNARATKSFRDTEDALDFFFSHTIDTREKEKEGNDGRRIPSVYVSRQYHQ